MESKAVIEINAGRGYFRWVCDVCGETQGKDGISSMVIFETGEGEGEGYEICRDCLENGVEGAVARSLSRAKQLEELAKVHRIAIPNVLRLVAEWRTGKDYDAVRDEWEEQFRREDPVSPEREAAIVTDEFPF